MNQQEAKAFSGYEASPEEIEKVITEWAIATDAFHRRYAKLNQVINSLQMGVFSKSTTNRARLKKLTELRDYMSDVLMTLMMDMSGLRPGHSDQPSKPGQLHSHASLLDELNRRIDAELISVITVAQA